MFSVPIIPDYLLDIDKHELEESLHRKNESFYENGTGLLVLESIKVSENSTVISFAKRILQLPLAAVNENSKVGWLLSSKALVQLIANPFIGPLSNK